MQDRERRLIPDEEKVARADFAYVNDGSLEELDRFVSGVVEKLCRMRVFLSVLVLAAAVGSRVRCTCRRAQPAWYERLRYPLSYEHIVVGHAANYDLDPALVAAVIYRESKFDARARSSSGAMGLMQLLPDTAKGIAVHTGGLALPRRRSQRPRDQRALRRLLPAAAADEVRTTCGLRSPLTTQGRRTSTNGSPQGKGIAFAETREYVDAVLETRDIYAHAYRRELGLD